VDDWSSVHDRVSKMVGSVMGHCMVGNWMGNSMMGNGVGHGMVGHGMVGHSMVGHGMVGHGMVGGNSMVGNWMGHCMGDRVSQEANTMVSWRMVDRWQVVDSGSHSMVGSVVNCWCGVVHKWCGVVNHWGSMVHNRGSMVHNWGSMVHKWCCVVHNRGSMVHNRGSVNRSLIIDCLSSVSHFLDHPISTIVVSHSLHSSIGQCDGVRAGGGVAISGLLLLEVGPAVVVVDPVLVGICRRLAQVLVGSWGSLVLRGSQTTADKGQQQGNLGGRGFWRSQAVGKV